MLTHLNMTLWELEVEKHQENAIQETWSLLFKGMNVWLSFAITYR